MLKKILFVAGFLCLISCKDSHKSVDSADLESATVGKKIWSCVGPATISSPSKPKEGKESLVRISVFSDGNNFTQVQLYQAASGAASTWKPSGDSKVNSNEEDGSLIIPQMTLVGEGAKRAGKGQVPTFNLTINKNKPAKGPEYQFKTYSEMKGFQAEISFRGISVVGGWVQEYSANSSKWVCSNNL